MLLQALFIAIAAYGQDGESAAQAEADRSPAERVAALFEQFDGTDAEQRAARMALDDLGPEDAAAAPLLIELMSGPHADLASVALGKMGPAIESLMRKGLVDEREEVRTGVAYAFMKIDESVVANALEDLRSALKDSGADMSAWIVTALGRLGEAALPAVPEIIESARLGGSQLIVSVSGALRNIGEGVLDQALDALQHENGNVRSAASRSMWKLAPLDPDKTIGPLMASLSDEVAAVRGNAAWALGEIGTAAEIAVPPLLRLLRDSDRNVYTRVPKALARIAPDDPRVIASLTAAMSLPDRFQVSSVINAIGIIGPQAREAIPALTAALQRDDLWGAPALALSAVAPRDDAVFRMMMESFEIHASGLVGPNERAINAFEPNPDTAALAIARKIVDSGIIDGIDPQTPSESIGVMQALLRDNLVAGKSKRFVLLWLGKIGTKEAVDAIAAFDSWAEARPRHGESPPVVHPGSTHYDSHPGGQEPWLTCLDTGGRTWELYQESRYGGGRSPVYRVSRKDAAEPPVWIAGVNLDDKTYREIMRSRDYSLEMREKNILRLRMGERTFEFDLVAQANDTDRDGLPDVIERVLTTDLADPDSDGDGIGDAEDGNPLTPKQTASDDEQEIRQALFSFAWATSNEPRTVAVREVNQEFYGFPGVVVPADESRKVWSTIWFGDIEFVSDSEATATISDYMGSMAASGSEAILRKLHGKWVVVKFAMTWIS